MSSSSGETLHLVRCLSYSTCGPLRLWRAAKNRRSADAKKLRDLRMTYQESVSYALMLDGSFDAGYLGIQSADGVDWVWMHRLNDLDPVL